MWLSVSVLLHMSVMQNHSAARTQPQHSSSFRPALQFSKGGKGCFAG